MAKQQRGTNRVPNRPAGQTPSASSNRPSGQRPSGQRPAASKSSSGGAWQPNRVSASSTRRAGGMSRTGMMTIGAIVVGIVIVAFVALQQLGGGSSGGSGGALITPGGNVMTPASIPESGRTLGDPNAPVTIDLYGDFRCSACYQFTEMGTATQVNTQLVATGKAKIVWHDYLIIDHNDGARASHDAANAAWCAADQNKFWLMHDWLYANQTSENASVFTIDRLLKIGQAAGLDMTTFTPCVNNGSHAADISAEDGSTPAAVLAHGTPSILIGGNLVNATFADIKKAVDAATPSTGGSSSSASPAASASAGSSPSGS